MKRVYVPTSSIQDWRRLLAEPELHWKKGRSAMATASAWEDAAASGAGLPPEISETLATVGDATIADLKLLLALPEWQVDLPGGRRPSQTDVMALARNDLGLVAIAVEAKVDETFGPVLKEKRKDASTGQTERLAFLHERLGLRAPLPDDVRYQLLHRTVSAVLTAQEFHADVAVMAVQSFSPTGAWHEDFTDFAVASGARQVAEDVYWLSSVHAPRVYLAWCRGDEGFLGG